VNPFLAGVNQKRLFASLLLAEAARARDDHLREALMQGALHHLATALQLYFGEVAATYQCRNAIETTSLALLDQHLSAMGKTPAEVSEMLALQDDAASWLSRVLACRQLLFAAPRPVARQDKDGVINALSVADDSDSTGFDVAEVEHWLSAFTSMIERHRESMLEC